MPHAASDGSVPETCLLSPVLQAFCCPATGLPAIPPSAACGALRPEARKHPAAGTWQVWHQGKWLMAVERAPAGCWTPPRESYREPQHCCSSSSDSGSSCSDSQRVATLWIADTTHKSSSCELQCMLTWCCLVIVPPVWRSSFSGAAAYPICCKAHLQAIESNFTCQNMWRTVFLTACFAPCLQVTDFTQAALHMLIQPSGRSLTRAALLCLLTLSQLPAGHRLWKQLL